MLQFFNFFSDDFKPHLFVIVFGLPWAFLCRSWAKKKFPKGKQNGPHLISFFIGVSVVYVVVILASYMNLK